MARFVLYEDERGYLLDVQTDLLDGLNTRLVVPLIGIERAPKPIGGLNPIMEIGGHRYSMTTQYMAATPSRRLGKPVANLQLRYYHEVQAALDMIFLGF